MDAPDTSSQRPSRVIKIIFDLGAIVWILLGFYILTDSRADYGTIYTFIGVLLIIYFSFSYGIREGYYTPEILSKLNKNGLKARMKIEEIELVTIIGALLFVIYLIFTSLTDIYNPSSTVVQIAYMKIFALGIGFSLLSQWTMQNQFNLKVLGDLLDELD